MAIDQRKLSSALRMMPDQQLYQVAQAHKADPYIFPPVFQESQRRQMLRSGMSSDDKSGNNPVPVNEQALMAMAPQQGAQPMPESVGLGALPMKSDPFAKMAAGGIVAFAGGGNPKGKKVPSFEDALDAEGITDPQQIAFLKALYGQESGSGANTTTSNRGAVGNMQILPGTFKEVADAGMDINNPFDNMRAGIRYGLKGLRAAKGDPVLGGAHYYGGPGGMQALAQGVARKDPKNPDYPDTRQYGNKIGQRVAALLPIGSAQAQTAKPETAATAAPQDTSEANTTTSAVLAGIPALTGALTAAKEVGAPFMRSLGLLKQGTPPLLGNIPLRNVTGRMAMGAAAVPAGIASLGANLSQGAANALTNATDEQLEQLQNDIGSDTSGAASIILAQRQGQAAREGRGPALPPTMPYGEQMKNAWGFLGKAAVLHPDVTGQGQSVSAREPFSTGEYRGKSGDPDEDIGPASVTPAKVIAAAKSTMTPEEQKESGYSAEDWLTLGFALLGGTSPNTFKNFSDAFDKVQTRKMALAKAGLEALDTRQKIALAKAQERKYGAESDILESGSKAENMLRTKAAMLAAGDLEKWRRDNIGATPQQVDAERTKLLDYYTAYLLRSDGTMTATAPMDMSKWGQASKV